MRIALDEIGTPRGVERRRNDIDGEAALARRSLGEHRRVALTAAAEAVIVADDELAHVIAIDAEVRRTNCSAEYAARARA